MDGRIIYSKEVLGKDSKPFIAYKLRTMVPEAEKLASMLAIQNGFYKHGKIISDPRITPLGKIIRKYFIDEVPQIYNIIRKEMDIIGIRPRTKEGWEIQFPKEHKINSLRYKPGLIGVQYYYPELNSLSDIVEAETEYLQRKDKDPIKTDIYYRNRIIQNILFKELRSS